jgi:gliding motility-associated lipoprotein GldH
MTRLLAVLILMLTMVKCGDHQEYAEFKDFDEGWKKSDTLQFKFLQPDTTDLYNLYFNIRVDQKYAFNNIYLISKIRFPHGKIVQDTLEYRMAKPSGELLGVGGTGTKESKLWYKQGVTFPEEGSYTVSVRQAMRKRGKEKALDTLQGVIDFGLITNKQQSNGK